MPVLISKYDLPHTHLLRDTRTLGKRLNESLQTPFVAASLIGIVTVWCAFGGGAVAALPDPAEYIDGLFLVVFLFFRWFYKQPFKLPLRMPSYAKNMMDPNNPAPGKSGAGKSEGILFLGNENHPYGPDKGRELWLTNTDARTHILFLGTTGSGKTEGLKSLVTNALSWGSGFVYVDGKADTDLWANLYAMARRFGRDDDLLVLNYMTGNSDNPAPSNTMNPFSSGSASYLSNMLVSLMPEAGGDNAMWKERAVALIASLMPALTWRRDHAGLLLDISVVRDHLEMPAIIRMSRDPKLPERVIRSLQSYLATLPGYVDEAFDDDGNERPPSPDSPMYDLQVARQQHGYLSMQFTRTLQSLGDEYGYIFKAQLADVDVLDVVLNRRMLVVLIPALEKSGDEAANLGKIVAACLKGMMGATLGAQVEGSWDQSIETKATRAPSPYMTVFDEVGYYTAQGMAVMAAQARSLGFSLIFAAQDLPAMEKRVKQEARSIAGNCNLKIFGKLEDPTDTKEFFEKTIGAAFVTEVSGFSAPHDTVGNMFSTSYIDKRDSSTQTRNRSSYADLKKQREGEVILMFGYELMHCRMFHAVAGKVKALRVQKMLPVPPNTIATTAREKIVGEISERLKDADWTVLESGTAFPEGADLSVLVSGYQSIAAAGYPALQAAGLAIAGLPIGGSAQAAKGAGASAPRQIPQGKDVPLSMPDSDLPFRWDDLEKVLDETSVTMTSPSVATPAGDGGGGNGGGNGGGVGAPWQQATLSRLATDQDIVRAVPAASTAPIDAEISAELPADIAGILQKTGQAIGRGLSGAGDSSAR
jgi:intracellular multiplication protein IcmO